MAGAMVPKEPTALQRLWWRIAGEPELWIWPRHIFFQFECDPENVLRLKLRLDEVGFDAKATLWYIDRETGQVWHRIVAPWEFSEIEIWEPATSLPNDVFTADGRTR